MIRVYLDSSDYSNMSDPRQPWAQPIRAYLKDQVDRGAVEIRFSSLHPVEGAHTESDAKPMAVERAKFMVELSGRKCLLWWHELIQEEACRLALGESLHPPEYAYRDDGRWFPTSMDLAIDLDSMMEKGLTEAIAETGAARKQRRYLAKQLMRNGRLTKPAIEMLRPGRAALMEELRQQYPWPPRFFDEDLFFRYATGELTGKDIADALEEGLGDLVFFIGWAYDRHDPEQKLTRWLRAGDWTAALTKIRGEVQELVDLGRSVGRTEKDVNAQLRKTRSRMLSARPRILRAAFEEVSSDFRRRGVSLELWEQRVVGSPLGSIPSLDAALEVAADYFLQNAMAGSKRELLTSDYGDMLHTGYLPYVDLFRCDGYAADLARKTASKYGTEIVGKLAQLPDAIERLKQRASAA